MTRTVALFAAAAVACTPAPAQPTRSAPATPVAVAAATSTPMPSNSAGARPATQAGAPAIALRGDAAERIASRLEQFGGEAAVVIADGRLGDILLAINEEHPVHAASLYKLAVLLEAERRIDAGTLRATDLVTVTAADHAEGGAFTAAGTVLTVDEALQRTIVLSDNAAALALIRRLGIKAIHATLAREGIEGLRFTPDGVMTTASAIAELFGELVRGSLISREASRRMLRRLGEQRVADRLPAALPAGAVVAHKTGNLGFATHDAGIVRDANGRLVVLVALTWGSGETEAIAVIRDVASLTYAGLVPPGT